MDNVGVNDFERDQTDSFSGLGVAAGSATLKSESSDGWCVDKITYGDKEFSICAGAGAWLDNPCNDNYSPRSCATSFDIDLVDGSSTAPCA